jgi:hypothetical protein
LDINLFWSFPSSKLFEKHWNDVETIRHWIENARVWTEQRSATTYQWRDHMTQLTEDQTYHLEESSVWPCSCNAYERLARRWVLYTKVASWFKKSHRFPQDIEMQKFLVLLFKKNKLITANHLTTKQASIRLHKHIKLSTNNRHVT